MTAPLRIDVCGALAVQRGGVAVRESVLPGRQGRRLWAYLVVNRLRPVGRDELASALWGDETPDAWDASLNALVSRLRLALRGIAAATPGFALRGTAGQYWLDLPPDAAVDRERAWKAIHHVHSAVRQGDIRGAWAEAVIAAEIAARGFLAGEEAPWIEAERRMLREIEMQALEAVAEAELAQGRPSDAVRVARRLLARDPLRESGYRLLMRALAADGNRAQVTRVMDECRDALRAVGISAPSSETERQFREILTGRSS